MIQPQTEPNVHDVAKFGTVIFKGRHGSHLYGTNRPDSDEDFLGVFVPYKEYIFGMKRVEEVDNSTNKTDTRNTSDDKDDKYYSLPKFVTLLNNSSPMAIEMLFCTEPNTFATTDEFISLQQHYSEIISKDVFKSFGGFAKSQQHKLITKKERFDALRDSIEMLERLFPEIMDGNTNYISIDDAIAESLNKLLPTYKGKKNNMERWHKGMNLRIIYSLFLDEYNRYGWRVHTESFERLKYDVKFAKHLIRLYIEGTELLNTGQLHFPIVSEDIIAIQNGGVEYNELNAMVDRYESIMKYSFENTKLREKPSFKYLDKYLIDTMSKYVC